MSNSNSRPKRTTPDEYDRPSSPRTKRKAEIWPGVYWSVTIGTVYLFASFLVMSFGWDDAIGEINNTLSTTFYVLGYVAAGLVLFGLLIAKATLKHPD